MKKDLAAGIALLCLSAGYAWMTRRIPMSSLSDGVGPQGLPNLLAIALAIVAVAPSKRLTDTSPEVRRKALQMVLDRSQNNPTRKKAEGALNALK